MKLVQNVENRLSCERIEKMGRRFWDVPGIRPVGIRNRRRSGTQCKLNCIEDVVAIPIDVEIGKLENGQMLELNRLLLRFFLL